MPNATCFRDPCHARRTGKSQVFFPKVFLTPAQHRVYQKYRRTNNADSHGTRELRAALDSKTAVETRARCVSVNERRAWQFAVRRGAIGRHSGVACPPDWRHRRLGHAGADSPPRPGEKYFASMIRPVGPLGENSMYANYTRFARSGPLSGALSDQLGAIERRRRLRRQQENLQAGPANYEALPPYQFRPRPPS